MQYAKFNIYYASAGFVGMFLIIEPAYIRIEPFFVNSRGYKHLEIKLASRRILKRYNLLMLFYTIIYLLII